MSTEEQKKKEVISQMAVLCSRSEQCTPDIRKKILASGLNEDETNEILNYLISEKYIDDERFVRFYVADKFKINKWGKIKIRHYLRAKGLNDETIETGLDQIDEKQYKDVLLKTMKEKAKKVNKKNKFEKMGQIIRFVQSRGFEPQLIHRYMNEVLK